MTAIDTVVMGAVAYDPKVVTIWDGFRRWFAEREFDFDYVLYSNYERQVEDLVAIREQHERAGYESELVIGAERCREYLTWTWPGR